MFRNPSFLRPFVWFGQVFNTRPRPHRLRMCFHSRHGAHCSAVSKWSGLYRPNVFSEALVIPKVRGQVSQFRFFSFNELELPMHDFEFMPALTPTMETGSVISWLKKEGEKVSRGDPLVEIETDKSVLVLESYCDGYLAKIVIPEGERDVPIGKILCVTADVMSDIPVLKEFDVSAAEKKLLEGSYGSASELEPLNVPPRSPHNSPNFYLSSEINIDGVLKLMKKLNQSLERKTGRTLSVDDFIIKASSLASKKVPEANSISTETIITKCDIMNIGVAVETKYGTIVPVVTNVERKGLLDIAEEVYRMSYDARLGRISQHQVQGGTFTISNLGLYGVSTFSGEMNPNPPCISAINESLWRDPETDPFQRARPPIAEKIVPKKSASIKSPHSSMLAVRRAQKKEEPSNAAVANPRQSCNLVVGVAAEKVVPDKSSANPGYFIATLMTVTLGCNPHVVGKLEGAQWLDEFKQLLENPETLLL